jgi:muskelin
VCGLTRSRTGSSSKTELRRNIPKWVYRYDKPPGKWTRILQSEQDFEHDERPDSKPQPRYAHQMVYDPKTDAVFMHGGNGGVIVESGSGDDRSEEVREEENRLDDFWMMKLKRCVVLFFYLVR